MRKALSLCSLLLLAVRSSTASTCERLKASLTYTQEEAPRDLSGLLPVIVGRINQVLEGVVDVEVEWTGADLHGRVGQHMVQCKVTRLATAAGQQEAVVVDELGRNLVTQCFHVPFTILDTNECVLAEGHPMRHQCHSSSLCVNTVGSYECICPILEGDATAITPATTETVDDAFWGKLAQQKRTAWDLSYGSASQTSCPGSASTFGCCPARVHLKGDGATCRAAFRCPLDPCADATHTCSSKAKCQRTALPTDRPNYTCECPAGLMGNGHVCRPGKDPKPAPKVRFDGVTATDETVANNYFCDCTKPVVDACSGFPACKGKHEICIVTAGNTPKCGCKAGYVMNEQYGCVDKSPPILRLKNDPNNDSTLRLKQGDIYQEYAVEIQDENAEEYLRSLKIAYSQPLPHGCFVHTGEFHVNYTVATPWTTPPYVRVTRRVIIEDINECTLDTKHYQETCPALIPRCHPDAKCVNTDGSYTCQCPEFTSGDGFQMGLQFGPLEAPEGFQGGTGCRDTHKPVIILEGPNPKVFSVAECGGLSGILWDGKENEDLRRSQQGLYNQDVKDLVRQTAGAELCATHSNPKPKTCVRAYDQTHKGKTDLSKQVRVGEPVQKSLLRWSVPYNVADAAGNAAVTVWRDVIVDEVDLAQVETKFRKEALQDRDAEVKAAVKEALLASEKQHLADVKLQVQKAVEEDRKRRGGTAKTQHCPVCPKCDNAGSSNQPFDESMCDAICKARMESCAIREESLVVRAMLWLEGHLPLPMIPYALFAAIVIFGFTMLRFFLSIIFAPSNYKTYIASEERERAMQNAVTVFQSPSVNGGVSPGLAPQPQVMQQPVMQQNRSPQPSLFSPQQPQQPPQQASPAVPQYGSPQGGYEDIYASPEVITPRRRRGTGGYVGTPFGPR